MTRTSNPKCPTCKKTVKNDDMTAICCESVATGITEFVFP